MQAASRTGGWAQPGITCWPVSTSPSTQIPPCSEQALCGTYNLQVGDFTNMKTWAIWFPAPAFPHAQGEVPRWRGEVPRQRQTNRLPQVVDECSSFQGLWQCGSSALLQQAGCVSEPSQQPAMERASLHRAWCLVFQVLWQAIQETKRQVQLWHLGGLLHKHRRFFRPLGRRRRATPCGSSPWRRGDSQLPGGVALATAAGAA